MKLFEVPQDLGRSNVLSSSELAEHREAKGIIRWFFLAIVLGASLCGNASVAQPTDDITVMSFNILRQAWQPTAPDWDTVRKADVIQTIQDKSPDFVGTQEENDGQMEDIIAGLPVYAEVPGRGITGGILYLHAEWDLVDSGTTLFVRYDPGNSKDRYFIWGLFTEKTTNRMIYVYSLHLPGYPNQATQEDRVAGMEQLATHAANRQEQNAPVILTGDFNAKIDTDPMRTLTGEIGSLPIEFIYAYQDVQVTDVSHGIDHILALPGTTVTDSGVAAAMKWDSGSDHPAVFAVIEPWFGDLSGYPEVSIEATDPTATEIGETTATFSAIRGGDTSSSLLVNFSVSGSATEGEDYVLSASSPITFPAGQSSVEIILTPTDDNVSGEGSETVTLTITSGEGYDVSGAPATATIQDSDNQVPAVDAGVDQAVTPTSSPWSPQFIDTTLWLDAADATTITESSGSVSQWADKNGNGKLASQGIAVNQPATGGSINGLNAIQFDPDGDADHLTTNLEQLTTVSMYLVLDPTAAGTNKYIAAIGASADGYGTNSGLFWPLEEFSDSSPRNKVYYTGSEFTDNFFVNGIEGVNHSFNPEILSHQGTGLPTANKNYLIGNRAESLNDLFDYSGLIGEIIICPEDHDEATRQNIEGYLAHKWSISLPSGHPYETEAPTVIATATLDATVTDPNGDPFTTTWSMVSGPTGGEVYFDDLATIDTVAYFTALGTYVLELTADDGVAQSSDQVTITVGTNVAPDVDAGIDQIVTPASSAPWSPAFIDTTLWLDAADTDTITTAIGTAVSQWADKKDNGKLASQSTAVNQPATGGSINGLNAIQFDPDGDADHLTTNLEQLTTVSMYLVLHPTAAGTNKYIAAIGASANGYGTNSGLFWPLEEYADSSPRNKIYYTNIEFTDNFFVNGVEGVNHSFNPEILSHQGTGLPTANKNYLIGNRAESLNDLFDYSGLIGEIIICPEDHDEATRQNIEGYLAHKWGISLPSGHPYETEAPTVIATATLDATVTDPDSDPFTTTWSLVSGPTGGEVYFGDLAEIDTVASFTELGTYVLELTADDSFSQSSDQVTITVSDAVDTFLSWIGGFDVGGQTAFTDDPDADGNDNGIENYFGTDPSDFSQGIVSGTLTGNSFTFTHPINDTPASDISASYRWSKDLASFHGDGATFEGTTVTFSQGTPSGGMVTVTATITGTAIDKLFVDIQVTQP